MSGGLIQLAAFGTQDILLTADPDITFFKVTIRRHTAFAIESIQQTITGSGTNFGSDLTITIARSGDLLWRTNLEVEIPGFTDTLTGIPAGIKGARWTPARWTDDIGHHLIQSCEVQIGGQRIDKHYSDWLQIWSQLTVKADQRDGYNKMIGNVQELCGSAGAPTLQAVSGTPNAVYKRPSYRVFIPLQFWFCRSPGMALPLIALPYHEVKLMIHLNSIQNLIIDGSIDYTNVTGFESSDGSAVTVFAASNSASAATVITSPATDLANRPLSMSVWADYIYLDVTERKRFAQTSHEYLIDQLQFTGAQNIPENVSEASLTLNFNHPTKELIWVLRKDYYTKKNAWSTDNNPYNIQNQWSNYQMCAYNANANKYSNVDGAVFGQIEYGNMSTTDYNPMKNGRLMINGNDRFRERVGEYFNLMQTYQHHTCIPQSKGINVYSFGLYPEDIQPSGTINFSRIDNTQLIIHTKESIPAKIGYIAADDTTGATDTVNANSRYIVKTGGSNNLININEKVNGSSIVYNAPTTGSLTTGYNVLVYATNYNVLRIISGMGGLAFSN